MAFTADNLTAIDAAIASGELTVRMGERLVTYRSIADLLKTRALIQAELAAAGSVTAPTRRSIAARLRS